MSAVAEALLLTPSAVSQQIALLESEVGVELIERHGRGVRLTPAGTCLVSHVEKIVGVIEQAKTDIAELKRTVAGELRVTAFASVATALIPQTINILASKYPALQISFTEMEPTEALGALRAWQTDLAFVYDLTTQGDTSADSFEMMHILDDRLYVLMAQSNPLAERPFLTLSDLQNEKWAWDNKASDYSNAITRACREAGFEPSVNGLCQGFEVVHAMVAAGCSISIQPGLRVLNNSGNLCIKELHPPMFRKVFVAIRRRELRNPTIKVFISELETAKANLSGRAIFGTDQ
jgi:DNA-binding transcriptional LysR family regulator